MSELTQITTPDNSPFFVEGEVNSFQAEGETIALCRCGFFATKLFGNDAQVKM